MLLSNQNARQTGFTTIFPTPQKCNPHQCWTNDQSSQKGFFVERSHLFMDAELEATLSRLLLPFLNTFEEQLNEMGGGFGEESIFVWKMLPMYANTALKEGVYYITNHPKMPHLSVSDRSTWGRLHQLLQTRQQD
jgi:hypothetical protein